MVLIIFFIKKSLHLPGSKSVWRWCWALSWRWGRSPLLWPWRPWRRDRRTGTEPARAAVRAHRCNGCETSGRARLPKRSKKCDWLVVFIDDWSIDTTPSKMRMRRLCPTVSTGPSVLKSRAWRVGMVVLRPTSLAMMPPAVSMPMLCAEPCEHGRPRRGMGMENKNKT